jgi:SAM-dependent methyltransferase
LLEATRSAYDRLASRFETFGRQEIRASYRSLLPTGPGVRVLDAGCGAGQDSSWLAGTGASVVAVDVSPEMVRHANRRAAEGMPFEVRLGDAERTGEPDGAFDAVLSSMEVMHHAHLEATLAEYSRLLRVGGRLVLVTNHPTRNMLLASDGSYFSDGTWTEHWGPWGSVDVQHWQVCGYVSALRRAEFLIGSLLELEATGDVRGVHDMGISYPGRFPSFLVFSCTKGNR